MRKIVAIGGGEIGRPGHSVETLQIDLEIVRLAGKKRPTLLFIPTACGDSEGYCEVVRKHFGGQLNCFVDTLLLTKQTYSHKELVQKIISADIVYVGGGNTQKMMRMWRSTGVDLMLKRAWKRGVVMAGLSAGSICWFTSGVSDSRRFSNPKAPLILVNGLGFIDAVHAPHFDVEKDRGPALKRMIRNKSCVAIVLDNCCALEIVDDTYRVVSSRKDAHARKMFWSNGTYFECLIQQREKYMPVSDLLAKAVH
jgi:dipeptidase E